jgi:hypothetical protein
MSGRLATAKASATWAFWPPDSRPARRPERDVRRVQPIAGKCVVPFRVQVSAEAQQILGRELRMERAVLGHEADFRQEARIVARTLADHAQLALGRRQQPDEQVQQRRLARAVRADDGSDRTGGKLQRQIARCPEPAVATPYADRFDGHAVSSAPIKQHLAV